MIGKVIFIIGLIGISLLLSHIFIFPDAKDFYTEWCPKLNSSANLDLSYPECFRIENSIYTAYYLRGIGENNFKLERKR